MLFAKAQSLQKDKKVSIDNFIPVNTVTANQMAEAIISAFEKLLSNQVITDEGYSVVCEEAIRLKSKGSSVDWTFAIDPDEPIRFTRAEKMTKDKEDVNITVFCDISVCQSSYKNLPFTSLDIAAEFYDDLRNPLARWHIDLANKKDNGEMQPGTLTHLQYGGHCRGNRAHDHKLKIPRWNHPPVDVILLSEIILANFYPEHWELMREELVWREAVRMSQSLFYSAYLRRYVEHLTNPDTTILYGMDASNWL